MKKLLLSLAQAALRRVLSVSALTWVTLREAARELDDRADMTPADRHAVLDGRLARMLPAPEPIRRRIIQAVVLANRLEEFAH